MASAYSVFSLAMRVRLLISGLLFILRSCRASRKSAATSAAGRDMMGKYVVGLEQKGMGKKGVRGEGCAQRTGQAARSAVGSRNPDNVDFECQTNKIDDVLPRSRTHVMTVFVLFTSYGCARKRSEKTAAVQLGQ
jgi:hypothetical protein